MNSQLFGEIAQSVSLKREALKQEIEEKRQQLKELNTRDAQQMKKALVYGTLGAVVVTFALVKAGKYAQERADALPNDDNYYPEQ